MPPAFTQNVGRDAVRDPHRRLVHRIPRKMRMSVSPARSQTMSQGSFRLRIGLPLTLPGMTKGFSGTRGIAASTPAASGDSARTVSTALKADFTVHSLLCKRFLSPASCQDLGAPRRSSRVGPGRTREDPRGFSGFPTPSTGGDTHDPS